MIRPQHGPAEQATPESDNGMPWQTRGQPPASKKRRGSGRGGAGRTGSRPRGAKSVKKQYGMWRAAPAADPDSPDFEQTARLMAQVEGGAAGAAHSPMAIPRAKLLPRPDPWWKKDDSASGSGCASPGPTQQQQQPQQPRQQQPQQQQQQQQQQREKPSTPLGYWDWGFPDEPPSQCTARPYEPGRRSSDFGV